MNRTRPLTVSRRPNMLNPHVAPPSRQPVSPMKIVRLVWVGCLIALSCNAAVAKSVKCIAEPLDLARVGKQVDVLHVFTGSDNKSHAEMKKIDAVLTTYLGLQLAHFDFGDPSNVVIVRGPANFDIPVHAAPYREIFVVLSGGSTVALSDGTRHRLKPGSVVLFEDVTGPGHGGKVGPCGYVALDLQFKPQAAAAAIVSPVH